MSGTAPRIAFVGTCQASGMADVAARLLPEARITDFLVVDDPVRESGILAEIAGSDLVVTQIAEDAAGGAPPPFSRAWLRARGLESLYVPAILFTGFHPDMGYIVPPKGLLGGAYSPYHSQLVLGGFLLGLDEARTLRLFNAHVFAELGYLDAYAGARVAMIATFAAAGYDLAPILERLEAERVVFMHTVNHPAISLLAPITIAVLARAGLIAADTPPPADVRDHLLTGMVVPVHAPIARRLGFPVNDDFLQPAVMVPGASRAVSLPAYVARSFEIYRGEAREELVVPNMRWTFEKLAGLLMAA